MSTDPRPYSEYRDSGLAWLGKIPMHWDIRRNGRLFAQRNETGFADLPILEVSLRTGVRVRDFDNSTRKQVMSDREKYKRAARGDVAYNMMRMWQGAVGVAPVDGLISPAYVVARPYPEVDSRYYAFLFRTAAYMNEVDKYSRGIVKDRNRLYWDEFKQMPSAFPPPDEQRRIANFLDEHGRHVRQFIRNKRWLIELLNEQRQAVIRQAMTCGADPNVRVKSSGVSWLGDVPEHWEVWQISHFANVGNGSTPSRGNAAYWSDAGYPWLNSASVHQGKITKSDQFVTEVALRECHLPRVRSGSVLIAITGQGKTRGTAAALSIEATINQHLAYISPTKEIVSPDYLQMCLTAAYVELRAISSDSGSTRGALTCEDVKHFKIALPPHNEQYRLLDITKMKVAAVEDTIARAERAINLVREYRTRLIAGVVTGEVDVRHLAPADLGPLAGNLDETEDVLDDELATTEENEPGEGLDDADE